MRIFINPGHDRNLDSGAVGFNLRECDIAWSIGELLAELLRRDNHAVKILQNDDLNKVCTASDNFGADIFCSIHCNAFNGSAFGTEVYYYPNSYKGQALAYSVQSEIVNRLGTANRGIKTANFFVLRYTLAPAILVETAFIDNYFDNKILRTRQSDFARAIAQGLTK